MNPTIAHVLPFAGGIGGTEIATLRLAQAARTHGFESVMCCPAPQIQEYFASEGFRTLPYKQVQPSYRHPADYWRNSWELARAIRSENASLVHCGDSSGAYFTSLAAILARKKLVCHIRNRDDIMSKRDQSFLRPVSKFIFVSSHTWRTFAVKIPERRGMVLYDGIEPRPPISRDQRIEHASRIRAELKIPPDVKIVGMVARVCAQKDYLTLIRAASEVLKKHRACFLIVGDYSLPLHLPVYEEAQRLLAELGISSHFVFAGFRRDVPELVSAMDLYVLSTHFEGFPLVLLEGMADARPILATAVDGIPEIVVHEKTGMLHNHQDHDQLAANLNRLLDDPALAARLGDAGKEIVLSRFSRFKYERDVGSMYRSLIRPASP